MDNGTEVKPNYTVPENVIGVDENYLSQLMSEAEKLGPSFPLCSELLARGMFQFIYRFNALFLIIAGSTANVTFRTICSGIMYLSQQLRLANSGFGHSGTPSTPFQSLPLPPYPPSFSPPLPPSRSPSRWAHT